MKWESLNVEADICLPDDHPFHSVVMKGFVCAEPGTWQRT